MIRIWTLSNNTALSGFKTEHGLSLLVEAFGHSLLFDCGMSRKFMTNAKKMALDLTNVEHIILSHSHYDHTWGLKHALKTISDAKIYAGRGWDGYYPASKKKLFRRVNIGVKPFARRLKNVTVVDDAVELMQNIWLLSRFEPVCGPRGQGFSVKIDGKLSPDDMRHEVVLCIKDEGWTLITGCGHNGLDNIIAGFQKHFPGETIKAVVGGFHIRGPKEDGRDVNAAMRKRTIACLSQLDGLHHIITGHCTGERGLKALQEAYDKKVVQLMAGEHYDIS